MTGKRKDPLGGWRGSTTAGQRISVSTLKRWKLKKNCTPNTPSCRTFPNEPSFPALWNTTLMAGSRVSGSSVLSSVRFTSLLSPRVVKERSRGKSGSWSCSRNALIHDLRHHIFCDHRSWRHDASVILESAGKVSGNTASGVFLPTDKWEINEQSHWISMWKVCSTSFTWPLRTALNFT